MSTWATFESEAPDLAAVAARLWPGITALHRGETPADCFRIAFLASVRPDGGPRLHPFCPILAGGRLFAAIPRSSPKGSDLRRDPRCVIHALPGPDDDELCIRARGRDVTADQATRDLVRGVVALTGVGGMIETVSHDPLFEFQLERVDVAKWLDIGQPGTRPVRQRWPDR
jgi:Pyridoxamine 5'-phosphate oxidase